MICYLLSVVHDSVGGKLSYVTINKATCFDPLGVIFRLIKYGILKGSLQLLRYLINCHVS